MKFAITDLGSNTVRMSVYDIDQEGRFKLLFSEKRMAGLASYMDHGALSAEGIGEACRVLESFQWLLEQFNMSQMHVFATASLRNIRNTRQAVEKIRKATGLAVDVLSGEDEATLDYYGAMLDSGIREGAMFDIGGGSTEIVGVSEGKVSSAQSFPVGSLNLFNRFVTELWPAGGEMDAMKDFIRSSLAQVELPEGGAEQVCGIGGTARAVLKIANAYLDRDRDCRTLTMGQLQETAVMLAARGGQARKLILKHCPDRVHTILPGMLLMTSVCGALCRGGVYISKYGVREGYLCRKLLRPGI